MVLDLYRLIGPGSIGSLLRTFCTNSTAYPSLFFSNIIDTFEVEVHQDPTVKDPLNSDELYDEATLQNLDPESIKKLRTTEKSRLTRIGSKIINLLRKKGSRSEIKFQRKCFTEQISEVMKLHEKYSLAKNSQETQDGVWVKQIDTQPKWLYSAIEDFLRKTSFFYTTQTDDDTSRARHHRWSNAIWSRR